MSTEWNRTGAVPEASPLSAVVWNEAIVVTNGAAVLQRGRDSWQRMGDHLAGVVALVVTPRGDLVAGGHFGVHRWDRVGSRWVPMVALTNVIALAADDAQLFAATELDGVFVSSDDGATWRPCSLGLTDQSIEWMRATESGLVVSTPTDQFELRAGASRWQPTGERIAPSEETSIIHPGDVPGSPLGVLRDTPAGLVWAARDGAEHRSTDDGATWSSHGVALEEAPLRIDSLPADLREFREGSYGAIAVVERPRLHDRWTAILRASGREGPWLPILSTTGTAPVVLTEHDGGLLVAVAHRILSDDLSDGSRPRPVGELPDPHSIVLALTSQGDDVLAATANGVWYSRDGGASWECSMPSSIPIVAVCAGARQVAMDADGAIFTMQAKEAA